MTSTALVSSTYHFARADHVAVTSPSARLDRRSIRRRVSFGRLSGRAVHLPDEERTAQDNSRYAEYVQLHAWFGGGGCCRPRTTAREGRDGPVFHERSSSA